MEKIRLKNGNFSYREKVRTSDGRIITKTFSTQTEARKWKTLQNASVLKGEFPQIASKFKFEEVLERWFESHVKSKLAHKTVISYRYMINAEILPFFKSMQMRSIDQHALERFRGELIKSGKASKTVNNILACLTGLLRYAYEAHIIHQLPCRSSIFLRETQKEIEFFNVEECSKLLSASLGHPVYPIFKHRDAPR